MPDPEQSRATEEGKPTPELCRFLENEIQFERTRKQEIFAWASSLLVAIIGGVIALTMINNVYLGGPQRNALQWAIAILGLSSCIWIHVHWEAYRNARKKLVYYYKQIWDDELDHDWTFDYTGIIAILALSAVAIYCVRNVDLPAKSQVPQCHCSKSACDADSGKMKAH